MSRVPLVSPTWDRKLTSLSVQVQLKLSVCCLLFPFSPPFLPVDSKLTPLPEKKNTLQVGGKKSFLSGWIYVE